MNKAKWISFRAFGMLAAVWPAGMLSAQTPPNILLIMTDQQSGQAMGCAGADWLHTPAMDGLAERGVRFVNAYCTAPLSGPSRSALFTGAFPDKAGLIRNGTPLPDSLSRRTLGNLLSAAGYDCLYAGKWHVHEIAMPEDGRYGFRRIHGFKDEGLAEAVIAELCKPRRRPFFIVASFDNPHNICEFAREQNLPEGNLPPADSAAFPPLPDNYQPNEDDADVIVMEKYHNYSAYPTVRYTPLQWRRYRWAYARLVEKVDAELSKITAALDETGAWDNTIVIFTSDHGDGMGAHQWNQKSALYEEVVNVPLVVCAPGVKAGEREQLVSNGVDLFSSICEWAGSPNPGQGLSLRAALEDNAAGQDFVVCETCFDEGTTRGWMLRTARYKYVLYDKGPYREQLFNMVKDRLEQHNLATDPEMMDVLRQHRTLLSGWMSTHGIRRTRPAVPDVPSEF